MRTHTHTHSACVRLRAPALYILSLMCLFMEIAYQKRHTISLLLCWVSVFLFLLLFGFQRASSDAQHKLVYLETNRPFLAIESSWRKSAFACRDRLRWGLIRCVLGFISSDPIEVGFGVCFERGFFLSGSDHRFSVWSRWKVRQKRRI